MRLKLFVQLIGSLLVVTSIAGCGPTGDTEKVAPEGGTKISGAGATFPNPLYQKWIEEYENKNSKVVVQYDSVGSGEGVKRFMAGSVDFGASDAAMSDEEMAQVDAGVQLIPVVAGSIVLAYNEPDLGGQLKLPRDVYVDIFLGKITNWNDERIQKANPNLKLPKDRIDVIVRLDSSGTTYAFTNHLSSISEAWRDRGPGTGKLIDWPGEARTAKGNDGVAGEIKRTRGAIGYVEYGIAKRAGLSVAALENRAGEYIKPTGTSGTATLASEPLPENLRAFFPDPEGKLSYPVVTYSWLLLYKEYKDDKKAQAVKDFVGWCLDEGQTFNESLGYIRLSPDVVDKARAALSDIK